MPQKPIKFLFSLEQSVSGLLVNILFKCYLPQFPSHNHSLVTPVSNHQSLIKSKLLPLVIYSKFHWKKGWIKRKPQNTLTRVAFSPSSATFALFCDSFESSIFSLISGSSPFSSSISFSSSGDPVSVFFIRSVSIAGMKQLSAKHLETK